MTTVSVVGLAVLGTTVLGVTPAAAAGATIYVNAEGADATNCGTSIVQCRTIQAGVDKAQAGDTVLVAAGTYAGPVDITKGITVKSVDGAVTTVIDGAGLAVPNGLVNITEPGGDVTFTGFTVRNQGPSGNGDAFALTINDSSAADTITVSGNVFPGDGTSEAATIGVDSADTSATQAITDNEFSGLWEGVLLEGSNGPVDVRDNLFHHLIPAEAPDNGTYPPKGVFLLGDKNVSVTDQDVTGNTFRDYGGIGIDYRAGYDLGGCSATVCEGSLAGSITGNTFDLGAPAENNSDLPSQQPAAISLQSRYEGDALDLTIGGNTGVVRAPTRPILQVPGDGTVTITPGRPNTIVPQPAPTLDVPLPATILTDGVAKTFTASAVNNSGQTLSNARYDLTITGTKGITASQVKLQYDADPTSGVNFVDVPLTGTASAGDAITGSFGPAAGFDFPSSATPNVTDFRPSFPDSSTPADTLTTTVDLVQVSPGSGNPVINTLATSTSTTVVSDAPAATVTVASDAFAAQISATETTAVTATVKNIGGGVLANQTVTFTVDLGFVGATSTATSSTTATAVTNASGVATAYVGSTLAGTQTITATAGDATGTATKTYYANPTTLTLSPDNASFAAGTKQTFTATVTDVVGNPSPNTGVAFSNGEGPGLLNKANVVTDANGKASVTLTTATDDTGSGTLTATVDVISGNLVQSVNYTATATVPPTSVAGVTPSLGTLVQAGSAQTVTVTVVNGDNTAPPAGTDVDLLVSGATVANGTVQTNAAGVATFSFVTQHKGAFTVRAVAGGKSGTTSGVTPIRNVVTTIGLASPAKGTILALARTYPAQAGAVVAFYFVQNGKYVFFHNVATKADGTATITAPGRVSGGTYSMAARVVNNPDTDSVYSATKSIKLR